MPLNRSWHEANRMPNGADIDQRIAWHLEHAKQCDCGPIPAKLLIEIEKRRAAPRDNEKR